MIITTRERQLQLGSGEKRLSPRMLNNLGLHDSYQHVLAERTLYNIRARCTEGRVDYM